MPLLPEGPTNTHHDDEKTAAKLNPSSIHPVRFPFSSPMMESRTSPGSGSLRKITGKRKLGPPDLFAPLPAPPDESDEERSKSFADVKEDRSQRPVITVVTSISMEDEYQSHAHEQTENTTRHISPKDRRAPGFVTLADLKTMKCEDTTSSGKGWFSWKKKHAAPGVSNEERSVTSLLSESAPQSESTLRDSCGTTPSILISTPRGRSARSVTDITRSSSRRPSVRSSCYSQPSRSSYDGVDDDIPPLPTAVLPSHLFKHALNPFLSPSNTEDEFMPDSRVLNPQVRGRQLSDDTTPNGDDATQTYPCQLSLSATSSRGACNRASFDTVATRPRSHGWWNVITTPFLTRSNTSATRRTRRSQERSERPELPHLASAVSIVQSTGGRDEFRWERRFSPASQHSAALKDGGEHSASTDFTEKSPRWEVGVPASSRSDDIPDAEEGRAGGQTESRGTAYGNVFFSPEDPMETVLGPHDSSSRVPTLGDGEFPILFDDSSPAAGTPATQTLHMGVRTIRGPEQQNEAYQPRQRSESNATKVEVHTIVVDHDAKNAQPVPGLTSSTTSFHEQGQRPWVPRKDDAQPDLDGPQPPPYSPPRSSDPFPRPSGTTIQGPLPVSNSHSHPGASPDKHVVIPLRSERPAYKVPPPIMPQPAHRRFNTGHANRGSPYPPRPLAAPMTPRNFGRSWQRREQFDATRPRGQKEGAIPRTTRGWRPWGGCFSPRHRSQGPYPPARSRTRWSIGLTVVFVAMIVLIIALSMTLTRKQKGSEMKQSQWVNITEWPPIPTGVSTIAQPDAVVENSGCVFPATAWSCALPKEQQQPSLPNKPNQPNFRLDIKFRNDSTTNTTLFNSAAPKLSQNRTTNHVSIKRFLRDKLLASRDAASEALWASSPNPPRVEEQRFMGKTTDKIKSSFSEGELSPFYLSFLSTTASSPPSSVEKRSAQEESDRFPNIKDTIPPPDVNLDGSPKPAILTPFPSLQPLRLYDRGLETEHYGFYTYFDRSIFLESVDLLNETDIGRGANPPDRDGGSKAQEARFRCTWAQTRFLVQIWTRLPKQGLLPNGTTSSSSSRSSSTASAPSSPTATVASGDDFSRPGSFPYPITITTDRHGGDVSKKMIYCYGLNERGDIVGDQRTIQVENRAFGGELVGGGQGPLGKDKVTIAEGGMGGIDGGTGGCSCQWKNFRNAT